MKRIIPLSSEHADVHQALRILFLSWAAAQ